MMNKLKIIKKKNNLILKIEMDFKNIKILIKLMNYKFNKDIKNKEIKKQLKKEKMKKWQL